jgi:Tol biopolymer transport system component
MSKVDDELTRRLRRAERPVDVEWLFEGLEHRRLHRERLRKVQAGLLAFVVLAATAGGFAALRYAFDPDERDTAVTPSPGMLAANGEIVFAKDGDDDRLHIYAARADGSRVRQITEGATNDSNPAVSPDGRTVAFAHDLDGSGRAVIATVPIQGGTVTWQTVEHHDVSDPTWSPDGTRIAFLAFTTDTSNLYVAEVNGDDERLIPLPAEGDEVMPTGTADTLSHPTWSPDGTRIAVAVASSTGTSSTTWDLAIVRPDGTGLEWLIPTEDRDEIAPAWSPEGTRIAFTRPGEDGDEVWMTQPDGGSETLVATVDFSIGTDLSWSPDGSTLLVSDADWIYRVEATPDGNPRDNLVRLFRGLSPSWQPLPPGSESVPKVSPEPGLSEPEGRDIGLGFNLCNVERLGGIDFLGEGTNGHAWTGVPVGDDGSCPRYQEGIHAVVAADFDGDDVADASSRTIDFCTFCQPVDSVDFDADGDEELVVLAALTSTPMFMIYGVSNGEIAPLLVGEPGSPSTGHEPGEPLTFDTGGDEGFAGYVRCENFPADPVLVLTTTDHPIEGDTKEIRETRLALESDGAFHVIDTNQYTLPVSDPVPDVSSDPACGVNWQLLP